MSIVQKFIFNRGKLSWFWVLSRLRNRAYVKMPKRTIWTFEALYK